MRAHSAQRNAEGSGGLSGGRERVRHPQWGRRSTRVPRGRLCAGGRHSAAKALTQPVLGFGSRCPTLQPPPCPCDPPAPSPPHLVPWGRNAISLLHPGKKTALRFRTYLLFCKALPPGPWISSPHAPRLGHSLALEGITLSRHCVMLGLSHQPRTQWQGLGLTQHHPRWSWHKQAVRDPA